MECDGQDLVTDTAHMQLSKRCQANGVFCRTFEECGRFLRWLLLAFEESHKVLGWEGIDLAGG
jgi:hypothetical protein